MKSAERSGVGLSYDVRIWKLEKYKGARRTTYTVRWVVEGKAHRRTFATVKLAEAFRAELLTETRRGVPFHITGGLPSRSRHQNRNAAGLHTLRTTCG